MPLQLLDTEAAAELLGCTVATVEDRLRDGTLPGVQIGRPWRIPAAALEQRLTELALEQAAERRKAPVPELTKTGDVHVLPSRRAPAPTFG